MRKKLLFLLLMIIAVSATGGYMHYRQNDKLAPSQEEKWQKYNSGELISGLSIAYPKGWTVMYKKEYNLGSDYPAKYRLSFDFAPMAWESSTAVGWMGWGVVNFDVFDPQISINKWIDKNLSAEYRDGAVAKEDAKTGEKPTFLVSSKGKKEGSIGWSSSVILGSNYSYVISYSQDGYYQDKNQNFIKILKEEVFPFIHIN